MWPGLTIKATNKYLPDAEKIPKLHMGHTTQGIISTKENTQVLQPASDETTINVPPKNHYSIYVKVIIIKNTIYTDQTGNLPVTY